MAYHRTDVMLMEILQERKNITGFFDAIFGFLRRNTDFYHIQKHASEKIGFPKGVREQILFGAMQRYDPECKLNQLTAEEHDDEGNCAPPAVEEIEVETADTWNESPEKLKLSQADNTVVELKLSQADNTVEELKSSQPDNTMEENSTDQTDRPSTSTAAHSVFFAPSDYKNGACFDNYCWAQSLHDLELHVKLPPGLQTAKSLHIEILSDRICVRSKANPEEIILSGELSNKFKHNDAVWTVTEGKLLISLDKLKELWWEKLFVSEESIDVTKIDCERYIDELPEESQAAIHKLHIQQMHQDNVDLQQRTENESETLERLRKAWDADGSPFKNQPFDPSVVKFS